MKSPAGEDWKLLIPGSRTRHEEVFHFQPGRNRARILLLAIAPSIGASLFEKNRRMPGPHPRQTEAARPRWLQRPIAASSLAEFPVVAIGASAGGLDACRKLLDALPPTTGMAFIIVQHLDPSHDSMLVDLLAGHTSMPVLLATDGMAIERERVYSFRLASISRPTTRERCGFRSRRRDMARDSLSTSC